MALDHHGRAWVAAIADGRWADALDRVRSGRAGDWTATNRDGLNALMIAGRVGRTDLVTALTEQGARALDPSGNALQDWIERGERSLIDAYLNAVPAGAVPFPGLFLLNAPDGTPVLAEAVGAALNQGWLDLADRLLAPTPNVTGLPGWAATLERAAQNAVFHDRPEVLAWLDAHAPMVWPALRCPSDVLGKTEGNLLVLAGHNGSTAVVPWLLDHGVPPNGDLPHANGGSRDTARPWLVALDREAAQRTEDQPWATSWAAAWLDHWLADPRTRSVLTEQTGRFGHDLLAKLILREDLPRIDQVLQWHDFKSPDHDQLTEAFAARWHEPLAAGTGNAAVLDRVLQRTADWSTQHRQAGLKAAFERWTRDGTPQDGALGTDPTPSTVDPLHRRTVLRVLVQHGWDLNGETAQNVWLRARRPIASATVLEPALAEGWSPVASAQAWPSGPTGYTTQVLNALFLRGTDSRHNVPDPDRPVWASRWLGPQGWLRQALTPETWRQAWRDATGSSINSLRIDWAIEHLPDGVIGPEEAITGLLQWSRSHTSDPTTGDAASQKATLDRWLNRFAPGIPADHPAATKLVQQQVFDERADWFEACVSAFPEAVRHTSPTTTTSVWMIRRLADLGAVLNPTPPVRGPLVHQWLDEIARHEQTAAMSERQRRTAGTAGNRAGLVEVLRHVGPGALHGWALHRREEGEPLIAWAAREQSWSLVDVLQRGGANVNAKDEKGRTALSWALALHDKPASRDWQGFWPMTDHQDDSWNSYRLDEVVLNLLRSGARVDVAIPGKDRTVERAVNNPRHQPWLRQNQALWAAMESAVMHQAMASEPAVPDEVPSVRRARL